MSKKNEDGEKKSFIPEPQLNGSGKSYFDRVQAVFKVVLSLVWIVLIVLCIIYKDQITVDDVLRLTPADPVLASLVIILLFGLKSLCVVLWVGILYAATGVMFPLYEAIIINILGTVLMVTVPYVIGRYEGRKAISYCIKKYPRIKRINDLTATSDFWLCVLIRSNGILPCDIMSLYLGAVEVTYPRYILSSVIGMLPLAVSFPIISPYITNLTSPQFLIALGINLVIMAASFVIMFFIEKKSIKHMKEENE